MNKTKMMLAGIGGGAGLAVLVMAYFAWSAFSAKTAALEGDEAEGTDGLETVVSRAQTLSRKPVYPCTASLKQIESNRTALVEWRQEATKLSTRGDRVYPATTPAAFKTFLVSDAKRLAALPGSVSGVLVKPDFAFGPFKDYIAGGKMPTDAELAALQRQWDDVATVVEILAKSGIAELTDVSFAAVAADSGEEAKDQRSKARERKGQRARAKKASEPSASDVGPRNFTYVFSFRTKPAGLVKALNAFVVSERFITVDGFTFARTKDVIAEALGGGDEKKAASSGGRRGRRGRRAEAEANPLAEGESDKAKGGLVTDPLMDEPMSAVVTLTVCDFHSLESGEKAEEEKK